MIFKISSEGDTETIAAEVYYNDHGFHVLEVFELSTETLNEAKELIEPKDTGKILIHLHPSANPEKVSELTDHPIIKDHLVVSSSANHSVREQLESISKKVCETKSYAVAFLSSIT